MDTGTKTLNGVGDTTEETEKKLRDAAALISRTMYWCHTEEGDTFWRGVHDKLIAKANAAKEKRTNPHGEKIAELEATINTAKQQIEELKRARA